MHNILKSILQKRPEGMERGGKKETWSPPDKASMKRRCLSIMISEGQDESAKKRGTIQTKAQTHKQA